MSTPIASPTPLTGYPTGSHTNLAELVDNGPEAFLGSDSRPSPVSSPNPEVGISRSLQILGSLPSKAEFYGVAHRASIDVMTERQEIVR